MQSSILLFFGVCVSCVFATLPDFIKVCPRNVPDPEQCIRDSISAINPLLKEGIPSLNVPALEPLELPPIHLNRGPNSAQFKATFKNIKVHGASKYIITDLKPDLEKGLFIYKLQVPKVSFKGNYKMNVNILLLQFKGEGEITGNFTNYFADVEMRGKKVKIDGVDHLQFDQMPIKIKIEGAKVHLDNLFNGDKTLGDITNQVINDNADAMIGEIVPSLEKALSNVFTTQANNILRTASYEEMFPLT